MKLKNYIFFDADEEESALKHILYNKIFLDPNIMEFQHLLTLIAYSHSIFNKVNFWI